MYVFDITYLLKASIKVAKKFRVIPSSVFYPPIRVLSPHPCFIPSSVFYPLIRVLSPHPCFIPSSVFYPPIRVLSSHLCFIPSSVFYPLIRVLSPHPCFILSSVFYPLIRVLSPHPYPYPAIRIRVLSQPAEQNRNNFFSSMQFSWNIEKAQITNHCFQLPCFF